MRQGILNMAQGVFAAIRNPASHSTDELPSRKRSNNWRPSASSRGGSSDASL
ncbi:TIGR02391 family protein [Microbacterium sp. NPDC058389]|uniref:TIGR02391 family protein n=1 Tax=Microbacterium sp. NPDC058389 TaxID=3346475 RepID=UPI00365E22F3